MDWRRELIAKWLWHAFHGFERSELAGSQSSEETSASGFIDKAQLKLLTAHIGHSLGVNNSNKTMSVDSTKISTELEKHFEEKEGKINFMNYLEFLYTHTYIEPDMVNLKTLEESCWSICQKTYDNRVAKILDIHQLQRVWKLFNFLSESEDYPLVMCREETAFLMEKLILGTGNRWQLETFDYLTKGIKGFSFGKVMACFETNYVKGMDRNCVADSLEDLHDELIESVEKKGLMWKKGHKMAGWPERWFVLKPDGMYYYTDKSMKTQKGFILLTKDWSVESISDQPGAKHKNLLVLSKREKVAKEKIRYELSAPDPRTRAEWIAALQAVISNDSTESIHRIALEGRRQKRREFINKEKAEQDKLFQDNLDKIKQQEELERITKERQAALDRLKESEEERRKRELEEAKLRAQEKADRKRIMSEIERLKVARTEAEQQAHNEAALRLAKELEEQERRLGEQEERQKQQEELDKLKQLYDEQVELRQAEEARLAELKEALRALEQLLEEERQAKKNEEEIRALQARLLEEEAEKRKELEKMKEEQEKMLNAEREQRKGLEQHSEELAKIQQEQAIELQREHERLAKLADERKAADTQLQQAMAKLAEAEKRREEQEQEKKRQELELEKKKEELELKKAEQKRRLDERTRVALAKPIQNRQVLVSSHRGMGAFTNSEFELINEIRAREKQLAMSRTQSFKNTSNDVQNDSQGSDEVFTEE